MIVKVISLNLWWGGELFPAIIDFLKQQNADIVALQEVHDGHDPSFKEQWRSMEVLRRELGYPCDDYAQAFILTEADAKIPLGNAVLSKFPITDTSVTFLVESSRDEYQDVPEQWPIEPRVLQYAALDTPSGPVNLFNMHGVWDMAGDRPSQERQAMIVKTLAAIKDKPNVILTGDTNASQGNPVLKDLEQQLTSVFGRTLTTTFNMRRKDNPGYATAAVDHMYVSPSMQIVSKDCPDVDISDHRPLIVELKI